MTYKKLSKGDYIEILPISVELVVQEEQEDSLDHRVLEWLMSVKGKRAMEEAAARAEKQCEYLRKARIPTKEQLERRMTV